MKLVKIFSDQNFKNVRLNERFNVILAIIQDKAHKKDTHNLGKTSLIHVINFLLLDNLAKNKGLLSNSVFLGQTFYLEIQLNNGKYLVIRRNINSATKISFKLNEVELANFTPPTQWDEIDIAFEEAREKLNNYLAFNVCNKNDWTYRKSITYFLRTQQDYLDVFQLNKFSKGKQSEWKPFVFELLGFNGNLIQKKIELELDANNLKSKIATLEQEANVNTKEKDRILGAIDIKEQEKQIAKETIDKFNFYLQDNSISKEIIEALDLKIQALNTDRYRIQYEISKTEESLRNSESSINVQKLKQLFNEVQLYFPDKLVKQYDDLEKFNISISMERRRFLKENLDELKSEFNTINKELKQLESSKSEKLSFLTETDTYSKFKEYQKHLSEVEVTIERLKNQLKLIDKSIDLEDEIKAIDDKIKVSVHEISIAIEQQKHAEIRKIFNEIITEVVNSNALIAIKLNKQGNVDFMADYLNLDKIITSEAEGTSYKKLLCMAFDLALLIHYSKNSFFRFVYHDGIIEGLDNRIKIRLLDKIKSICNDYNIQHIITLIDSDIPAQNDGSPYYFDNDDICLNLNDLNDNGKLFMQSF
ncbi:MAG: DUF2326 domain-containing protein [Lentimicrobiaceae bacterium]|nr:DUF2326 domain-containing protein [Lentimicrobiaceae bacterium]